MSIEFGSSNGDTRYEIADASVINFVNGEDFTLGFWFNIDNIDSGNAFEYILSMAGYYSNGGFSVIFGRTDQDSPYGGKISVLSKDDGGAELGGDSDGFDNYLSTTTAVIADINYLYALRRIGNTFDVFLIAEGDEAVIDKTFDGTGWGPRSNSGTFFIGNRGDGATSRSYRNKFGELFFLADDYLTDEELTTLAAGANISAVRPTNALNLRFKTAAGTETDLSGSNDATRVNSDVSTAAHFFSDVVSVSVDESAASDSVISATAIAAAAASNSGNAQAALSIVVTNPAALNSAVSATAALAEIAISPSSLAAAGAATMAIAVAAGIAFSASGSSNSSFSDNETANVSLSAGVSASASFADIVTAALGFIAAGNATDSSSDIATVPATLVTSATGNALLDALANVAASITAAATAGESWADLCVAVIAHIEAGNSLATFSAETAGLTQVTLAASTSSAAAFAENIAIIQTVTGAASAQAAIVGTLTALLSISASGSADGTFTELVSPARVALAANGSASASLAVALDVHAALIAAGAGVAAFGPLTSIINSISASANAVAQFDQGIVDIHPAAINEALTAVNVFSVLEQIIESISESVAATSVFDVAAAVSASILFAGSATSRFVAFTGDKGLILLNAISLRAAIAALASMRPAISLDADIAQPINLSAQIH